MLKTTLALTLATAMVLPATAVTAEARHGTRYYTTDNGIQYWRGTDGRYRCKRSNGTTGLLIGGAAGALVGRAIDTHGSRTTGTVVGAAAGALLGREVERSRSRARCR
ncbi:glycine zipper 2TM domain-containing protein [Novosphingobium sp. Gsoil 351]|uniref:glycine zipper 2TM domain-containing protein n=1 Tax=Novosphingobium sp. Gsoil 351 TaxID=2675225 RepID=UPI0012B4FA5F|nr:glycine zipper 2TM domain-containing protein [Novosphingobium sp. Gsoil 351]QGN53654.1 glycine zipper 2TM domain-containing protein [Novosphingobium sp. Gsoil 351]